MTSQETGMNNIMDSTEMMHSSPEVNQRQRPRRSRRGVVRRTARAPFKVLQKIVRLGIPKRRDRDRRLIKRSRTRSQRRRRRRGHLDSMDDSLNGESMPLISSPIQEDERSMRSFTSTRHSNDLDLDMEFEIENIQARVLNKAELVLRQMLLIICVYLLGASHSVPYLTPNHVTNAGYLVGIAWGTCAIIKTISFFSSVRSSTDYQGHESVDDLEKEGEEFILPEENNVVSPRLITRGVITESYGTNDNFQLQRPVKESPMRKQILAGRKSFYLRRKRMVPSKKPDFIPEGGQDEKYNADDEIDRSEDSGHLQVSNIKINAPAQHHPDLEDLYLMDLLTGKRVPAGDIYDVENEYIAGKMLFMSRTSDADLKIEPDQTNGTPINDAHSRYFRKKKRRFELQFQVKFKKVPPSQLYFHCQLKDPLKLGVIQRAFVGATLNFTEKKNKGSFTYNVPGKDPRPEDLKEGMHEFPHLTFDIERAFDRLIQTKDGDEIPVLGEEIYEDPETVKRRMNGEVPVEYNTEDTFTFGLWSAYSDFTNWNIVNLPAIRPFTLKSVIRDQDISMHVYYLDPSQENGAIRHVECNQHRYLSFEMSNAKYCKVSETRKRWMEKYASQVIGHNKIDSPSYSVQDGLDRFGSDSEDNDVGEVDVSFESDDTGSEDEDSDIEEDLSGHEDEQTQAFEELGEGIYLKSGDSIILREATEGESDTQSSLTNGGGYATLQMEAAATVVIEKIRPKRHKKTHGKDQDSQDSNLVKNGDKIYVKLVDTLGTSYLSVHKGWWLKWVRKAPKSNGIFTLHTNGVEDVDTSFRRKKLETHTSYLRLGGTFHLRGVSGLEVGVRVSNSAKFGGRVLGLYRSGSNYVTEFDQDVKSAVDGIHFHSKRQMMMPLTLRVDLPIPTNVQEKDDSPRKSFKNIEDFRIDAPAWLETMHRSKRRIIRVYAIRMTRQDKLSLEDAVDDENSSLTLDNQNAQLLRLRTGKDLTPLLRLGLISVNRAHCEPAEDEICFEGDEENRKAIGIYDLSGSLHDALPHDAAPSEMNIEDIDSEFSNEENDQCVFSDNSREVGDGMLPMQIPINEEVLSFEPPTPTAEDYGEVRKKKKWMKSTTHGITKVAKGVKTGTIKSGTFIGKAVTHTIKGRRSHIRDKPRHTKGKAKIKDHHIAVNRALKKLKSPDKQIIHGSKKFAPRSIVAGQLKPPDQSCRTVSDILSNLSVSPSVQAKMLLSAHLSPLMDLDTSFLSGGPVELGVLVDPNLKGEPIGEYIVARAFWESHWREEACIIHESCVDFYSPLSSKPCFSIPFYDIERVRRVDDCANGGPLASQPIIAIETAWKCHYLVLTNEIVRTDFFNILNASIFSHGEEAFQKEEWNAHIWQGVQSSVDKSGESSKWASIGSSSKKKRQRIILNSRRMPFDTEAFEYDSRDKGSLEKNVGVFVQELLGKALSISLETLARDPKSFIRFLDDASRLKELPWCDIDKNGSDAFCISLNLYHCMLQHALLLSKTGPPTKKNVVNFMRTHCYEIGGDVFSLAELEACVIRGNLPKPYYPKPPYVQPHRSSAAYFAYALDYLDPRVMFVLNRGIMSHPQEIEVLRPEQLEEQLARLSGLFLNCHIKVDPSRKIVTLPKICDVYRNDFDGSAKMCVEYCLQFLNENTRSDILEIIEKNSNAQIFRYERNFDSFYSILKPKSTMNQLS